MSKFDVSSFSMAQDISIFKLVILLTLSSSKSIVILLTFGKITLLVHLSDFGHVTVILLNLGKALGFKKSFSIIQSAEIKN